jgi:hypothetical protein
MISFDKVYYKNRPKIIAPVFGSSAQLDRISAAFGCILSIRHTQFCEFVLLIPILGP